MKAKEIYRRLNENRLLKRGFKIEKYTIDLTKIDSRSKYVLTGSIISIIIFFTTGTNALVMWLVWNKVNTVTGDDGHPKVNDVL